MLIMCCRFAEEMLKLFDTTEQLGRGIKKLFHHLDYVRHSSRI